MITQQVEKAFSAALSASKQQTPSKKLTLPHSEISLGELANVLNVFAKQYNTTLPNLLSKLDKVSGDLAELDKYFKGDTRVEWTPEEDELLGKNEGLLVRWKGVDIVEKRKKYLAL